MAHISNIKVTHFKNYDQQNFSFNEKVVAITGANGSGKTNLLDAIYYICCTKSYFTSLDANIIQFGKDGFRLDAQLTNEDSDQNIVCVNRVDVKKIFTVNDVPYERLAEHVGKFPVLMIAPDDIGIITGTAEIRRKFIDQLLCQLNPEYLSQLIRYNKVLLQRNAALKNFAETGRTDEALLEILNDQLATPGEFVLQERKALMNYFPAMVAELYNTVAETGEQVTVLYETNLLDLPFLTLLQNNRQKDAQAQRTQIGVHKDDVLFQLNGNAFKIIASQGQKKSLLFALKLAAFKILQEKNQQAPILLLDDVFEKLDAGRLEKLLQIVCKENDGQVFITDTHKERLDDILLKLNIKAASIVIER